ncbi:4-hydroxybenzoate octaprenyltransferase [Faucicola boevrei]|uniref:4-hydroxybenzoate octaprenyltransferase n=1 Tax=Faucicola boevrei TaxID=346665 RepID=UPI000361509B|nr:4-hydroxybenzoate octaprenyltransferase [Moraxella boevrei]
MSATLFNPFRKEKWLAYVHLTRFDRPVGIELVLWSTLWAVFLAGLDLGRLPPWHVVLIFSLGATLMRGAGCAINDFADRKVDGHVTRTKHRPLADGRLTAKEAVWAFLVLSWISGALLIFLPIQVFYWSFGAVALAFIYPFMKRFTHLPQFFLAMAFGWAIPMAYVAVSAEILEKGSTNIWCWLLFVGYMAWTVAYDTQYAMADREDDIKIGVKSTAILFGNYDVFIISLLQAVFLACLAGVFWHYFGLLSIISLLPLILMFVYQNKLCRTYLPTNCTKAFLHNVWVGRYVFVVIVILVWLKFKF